MYNEHADIEDWKNIAQGWQGEALKWKGLAGEWSRMSDEWKQKCLTHLDTLTTIADLVDHSDEIENSMELIKGILQKANFIPTEQPERAKE